MSGVLAVTVPSFMLVIAVNNGGWKKKGRLSACRATLDLCELSGIPLLCPLFHTRFGQEPDTNQHLTVTLRGTDPETRKTGLRDQYLGVFTKN